jgi:hypothetical protein
MSVPYGPSAGPPGVQENGGVWQGSLNSPWVWALAGINVTDAWEQFLLNSLAAEAEVYGDAVWAGIWTSSDAVNSFVAEVRRRSAVALPAGPPTPASLPVQRPGLPSWDNFPVLCTHRHAWPLYALTKLAGISFDAAGLVVAPAAMPRMLLCGGGITAARLWSLDTPVVAVESLENGTWRGRYTRPADSGGAPMRLSARLPLHLGDVCWAGGLQPAGGRGGGGTARVVVTPVGGRASAQQRREYVVALRPPSVAEAAVWAEAAPVAAVAEFSVAPEPHSFSWEVRLEPSLAA